LADAEAAATARLLEGAMDAAATGSCRTAVGLRELYAESAKGEAGGVEELEMERLSVGDSERATPPCWVVWEG